MAHHGVVITVQPQYLPAQSRPQEGRWLFAYTITIHNTSNHRVQLLNRHWIITNGEGENDEVRGPGVVGQQPILAPGASFTYTSGCPLDTPIGSMQGSYEFRDLDGGPHFLAEIAAFTLAVPRVLN